MRRCECRAFVVEASPLLVPAPLQGVVYQAARDGRRLGVVLAQSRGGLQEQVGRFHVVSERIVVRQRTPVGREIKVQAARLDGDPIPHQPEHFAKPDAQRSVGPDAVQPREHSKRWMWLFIDL